MKDAPTVTNPAGRSHDHRDLQFKYVSFPFSCAPRAVSTCAWFQHNSQFFRATFNGTNQSSKVENLLSRAIIKTIDNASVTVHWLMNLPRFCETKQPHISPHTQLENSIRFRLGIRSVPSHFLEASLAFARSRS